MTERSDDGFIQKMEGRLGGLNNGGWAWRRGCGRPRCGWEPATGSKRRSGCVACDSGFAHYNNFEHDHHLHDQYITGSVAGLTCLSDLSRLPHISGVAGLTRLGAFARDPSEPGQPARL